MDTYIAIRTRKAVRSFTSQDVDPELLEHILDAGRCAPSPLNCQPWHFIVIRDKEVIARLMPHAHYGTYLSLANILIIVTVEEHPSIDEWLIAHMQHHYSGVCALQNMWLTAWNEKVGACWITLDESSTRSILHIPENHHVIGSLALGYSSDLPKIQEKEDRKMITDIVYYDEFGKAAP